MGDCSRFRRRFVSGCVDSLRWDSGCWSYVSTRNNNFSNRSQKGTICVDEGDHQSDTVGPSGSAVVAINSWVSVPPGTLTNNQEITIQSAPKTGMASEEVWIEPVAFTSLRDEKSQFQVAVAYEQRTFYQPQLVHRTSTTGAYSKVSNAKYEVTTDANGREQNYAMANVNEGGAYVVEDKINAGAVVAIVFAGLVFIGAIMFIVWWKFFKAPPATDEYSVNQGTV